MAKYDVRNNEGLLIAQGVGADEAAALLGVDAAELEWAVEEEGLCETDTHHAEPAGE